MEFFFALKYPVYLLYAFHFSRWLSSFSDTQACEKKRGRKSFVAGERQEKALYDTASVTQINLIKELQHSMAESHIIIQAKMQVYSVVMLKVQLPCGNLCL